MVITVSIQTYNNADTLARTLESLRQLRSVPCLEYEILVVDNNCTDGTAAVLDRYAKILSPRFRHVLEREQGLSHARNRALHEARGEIVSFLDDDVLVDPGWLVAVASAFEEHDADIVGGKSYLVYPSEKPAWLTAEYEELLSRIDYGDQVIVGIEKQLFGLNFSVRRESAIAAGGFNPALGRIGGGLGSGEEKDLQDRVAQAGGVIVYEPRAIVGHIVRPERLRKGWFVRRVYRGAMSAQRMRLANGCAERSILRLIGRVARNCGALVVKGLLVPGRGGRHLLKRQLDVVFSAGQLMETIRYRL